MTQETSLLTITPLSGEDGLTLPPYSARGLNQTLSLITGAGGEGGDALGKTIRRSINGGLINLFPSQFRKYVSTITCNDVETPAIDPAYIGQSVIVECCFELSYPSGGTPQRTEVSGSSRVEGDFVFYRPVLLMMVTAVNFQFDEFGAAYAWTAQLAEI